MPRAYDPRNVADEGPEGFETSPWRRADSDEVWDLPSEVEAPDFHEVPPNQPDPEPVLPDPLVDAAIALLARNGYTVTPPSATRQGERVMNGLEVNEAISPNDHMMTADLGSYFRTSRAGLDCIMAGLTAADRDPGTIKSSSTLEADMVECIERSRRHSQTPS